MALLFLDRDREVESYVDGVSAHYRAISRRVTSYLVMPTAMLALFAVVRWFTAVASEGAAFRTMPELVLTPVSGSNVIAMYAFLAAAAFAVRLGDGAVNRRSSGRDEITPSEFAERSILVVVSMLIGWAAVFLAGLCALWFFRLGEQFDAVRVFGPLAASGLLVVLAAENQYAAEVPGDPALRAEIERRRRERLVAALVRVDPGAWSRRRRVVQVALLCCLVPATTAVSLVVSPTTSPGTVVARGVIALLFTACALGLLVHWHVTLAERRYLEVLGITCMAGCIGVVYLATAFIVAADGASGLGDVVRPFVAITTCLFGPWVMFVLFGTRLSSGGGVVFAAAHHSIRKKLTRLGPSGSSGRPRSGMRRLIWLSVLVPVLPVVMARSRLAPGRERMLLAGVGWLELVALTVGVVTVCVLQPVP